MRKEHGILLALLLVCTSALAQAPNPSDRAYVVIVHPANPVSRVSRRFLADAFLKRTTHWANGVKIVPADLDSRSRTRRSFSEEILNRRVTSVRSYWQQIIFSGRGVPPVELDDDEDAVRFVLRHRGAVAYVSGSTNVGRTKIVTVR